MADWVGELTTAEHYRWMAEQPLHGVSPSYAAICLGVAGDAEVCARLDTLEPAKRQPNLLLAAVRFLGGPVGSWPAFRSFVLSGWDDVAATMRARRTQTNEARRCATLLPALAQLPPPLALLEVGASAGLCLHPDRWTYRFTGPAGTHTLGSGPELDCAITGPVPLPRTMPEIVWRAGLDLNPLDVADDEDVRWLESLVWPEQADRFERLRAAVTIARAHPVAIHRGDLRTDLVLLAEQAPRDATLVVFHSAVLAYVPESERSGFTADVQHLSATRNAVWLANEAPGVLAGTEYLDDGLSGFVLCRDGRPIARTGAHGHALEWL